MSDQVVLADLDTDVLEAALFGEKPVPVEPSDASVTAEAQEVPSVVEQHNDVAAEPVEVSVPAEEQPVAPSEEPLFRDLSDVEEFAIGLRSRNPDLSLEAALQIAKGRLGVGTAESAGEAPSEVSLEDRLAEIEASLDEAGANDGLFTSEIAAWTKEHARLSAELAAMKAVSEYQANVESATLNSQLQSLRQESYDRAVEMCPAAADENTAIGRMVSKVVDEAELSGNPLLQDPQAPEIFLAIANARLPEAERVEMKRPAGSVSETSGVGRLEPTAQVERGNGPASVLPVAASVRTAQPTRLTVDPSNVGRVIREMATDDLEAALLGGASGTALLRL